MALNNTPSANRIHIGFYGKRNSGKSSLINAITGQDVSIVSDVAGTTTDVVTKAMEISPIGPCILIDTAGFDDEGALGDMRVEKTKEAALKTDIAVILFSGEDISKEAEWFKYFKDKKTPVISVISKADTLSAKDLTENCEEALDGNIGENLAEKGESLYYKVKKLTKEEPLIVSSKDKRTVDKIKESLIRALPEEYEMSSITGSLANEGDLILLVMPQDIQAPKGRLILPQVQTIRDLLDKKCMVMSCTTDKLEETLAVMKTPDLIITDSQVFKYVYDKKPKESKLTSFSTLFAAYKGDLEYYIQGAKTIGNLNADSKILIAECCTHAPLQEDIGRVKIPRMLRQRLGEALEVDIVSGTDFPKDLSKYDLIIQCGGCMFNRKYIMSRIDMAKKQNVSMTNYGVTIAFLNGILDKISTT